MEFFMMETLGAWLKLRLIWKLRKSQGNLFTYFDEESCGLYLLWFMIKSSKIVKQIAQLFFINSLIYYTVFA
jgi:hypothetical protein